MEALPVKDTTGAWEAVVYPTTRAHLEWVVTETKRRMDAHTETCPSKGTECHEGFALFLDWQNALDLLETHITEGKQ
jgi:hypothetical protein